VGGNHRRKPWEETMGGNHGRKPWEETIGGNQRKPWEETRENHRPGLLKLNEYYRMKIDLES
jgi:hypothetical protein